MTKFVWNRLILDGVMWVCLLNPKNSIQSMTFCTCWENLLDGICAFKIADLETREDKNEVAVFTCSALMKFCFFAKFYWTELAR